MILGALCNCACAKVKHVHLSERERRRAALALLLFECVLFIDSQLMFCPFVYVLVPINVFLDNWSYA